MLLYPAYITFIRGCIGTSSPYGLHRWFSAWCESCLHLPGGCPRHSLASYTMRFRTNN